MAEAGVEDPRRRQSIMEREMTMDRIKMMAERIEPGLARRWIRRNWWRLAASACWVTAGIRIRAAVAAGRPESWPIGGEIIPMAACWALAAAVALGERKVRR